MARKRRLETLAIHAGQPPDPSTGAVMVPIYQTSTYVQTAVGEHKGYDYARSGNPTRSALEANLAALEGAAHGLAFASGMAATHCAVSMLSAGDHIVAGRDIYGGTYRLLHQVVNRFDVKTTLVDSTDLAAVERVCTANTKLVWIESPGNPLMSITEIGACAEIAHRHGALLGVDNTFASPVNFNPLAHGFDLVLHSCTKYMNGHSDLVAGCVVGRADLIGAITRKLNHLGGSLDPHACVLLHRGVKTLALRMRQHNESALALARFLERHPSVERVNYPGLESHPHHARARRLFRGFSGMMSIELIGGVEEAERFLSKLRIPLVAPSLGGVESLVTRPAKTSHAGMSPEERRRSGISEKLIRISVGIEATEDLMDDFEQALR